MDFFTRVDQVSLLSLRESGASKWNEPDDVIGAFVAEMDFGVADVIKRDLHAMIESADFGYLPERMGAALQAATADMITDRYGWPVDSDDVWLVPDVIKALELAITHNCAPGGRVVVPTPAYMPFLLTPAYLGREVVEVPMVRQAERYELDYDALEAAFEGKGGLLILCNPHNPTGRVFARDELEKISSIVQRHGGKVFVDEIWAPLVFSPLQHIPYASVNAVAASHSLTALSASKAWNIPGLKCAQVITSNDDDREVWKRIGFLARHGVSNAGVYANISAYKNGFDWLDDVVRYLDRNRRCISRLVAEKLPGTKYTQPEGTYVAWLDFRNTTVEGSPAEFFKTHAGVRLTDGAGCGRGFERFCRLIFATPTPILETLITRMGKALSEHGIAIETS